MRPIQTGWAEMPMSTNTIAARSIKDRGRRAERMPTGDGEEHPENGAAEDERGSHGRGVLDDRVDLLPAGEGRAERPVEDELLEELPVLDVERLVEPEVGGDSLDILRPCRLPGEELRGVRGNDVEDDVRDARHPRRRARRPTVGVG